GASAGGGSASALRRGTRATSESTKNAARRFNLPRPRSSLAVPTPCHPTPKPSRRLASWCMASLLWSSVCIPACGRTGLDADGLEEWIDDAGVVHISLPEASVDAGTTPPPGTTTGGVCVPSPETCNGLDDDCNGQIDDGLPAIPCPGGGARYCV